jgi:hypothetical protein
LLAYSISSSARMSMDEGMANPSDLANFLFLRSKNTCNAGGLMFPALVAGISFSSEVLNLLSPM